MRSGHPLIFALFALLMVFNVALPKGGIAVNGVPLTFGYLLLGAVTPLALIGLFRRPSISVVPVFHFLVLFLPIGLLAVSKMSTTNASMVAFLSAATIFFLLPLMMLMVFSSYLEALTEAQIGLVMRLCIAFVLLWGLMNFLSYALLKYFVEIPYITVNAADVGEIVNKNNRRGDLMKLVSTYNNGNICGVCLLMMMPLFVHFTKSRLWTGLICLAIVLTLSRTAWFGLVCALGVMLLLRLTRATNVYGWALAAVLAALLVLLMPLIGWTPDRLVDPTLGNRAYQWEGIDITLFGAPQVLIHEILYFGLLQSFGVIGLMVALAMLLFPVGYGLMSFQRLSALRRSALAGVIIYLIVAWVDAAIIYPPVFLQFLFLLTIVYRRGYSGPESAFSAGPIPAA